MRSRLSLVVTMGLLVSWAGPSQAGDKDGSWGTIKGQIVWGGKDLPKEEEVKVDKDGPACLKDGPIFRENVVVNKKNKGVRYVFVWLAPQPVAKGQKPAPLPIHPDEKEIKVKEVSIDQPCCKFEPHVLALRQGQVLEVKNSAAINHNVNYQGGTDNPGDNPILPAGKSIKIDNLVASMTPISVSCNIHGWMKGWVRVFNHPYFAVTDADGKFEIKNAPAGDFRLITWQEAVGWVKGGKPGTPITIKAGKVTELKVEMEPPQD